MGLVWARTSLTMTMMNQLQTSSALGHLQTKNSGIVYHDLTGSFPFMSFDGSVCFFVLYHYTSNAILATPIAGLDDVSIFNGYKKYFEEFTAKGFKP